MINKKTWDNLFRKVFMNWFVRPWFVKNSIFDNKLWRTFTVLYTLSFITSIITIPIVYIYAYYEENLYRYYEINESVEIEIQDIKNLGEYIKGYSDIDNFWNNDCLTISNNNKSNEYEIIDLGYISDYSYYDQQNCYYNIYKNSNYFEWNDLHPNTINTEEFKKESWRYIKYIENKDARKKLNADYQKVDFISEWNIVIKLNRNYHEDNIFIFYILPLLGLLFLKYWITLSFIIISYIFRFIKNG